MLSFAGLGHHDSLPVITLSLSPQHVVFITPAYCRKGIPPPPPPTTTNHELQQKPRPNRRRRHRSREYTSSRRPASSRICRVGSRSVRRNVMRRLRRPGASHRSRTSPSTFRRGNLSSSSHTRSTHPTQVVYCREYQNAARHCSD